jgi:hypothetical protein
MGTKTVVAWECDRCQNLWIAKVKPKRCAKCKSRTWDKGGASEIISAAPVASRVDLPGVVDSGAPRITKQPAKEKALKCPACGKPTIEWGSMRRCVTCNRNY